MTDPTLVDIAHLAGLGAVLGLFALASLVVWNGWESFSGRFRLKDGAWRRPHNVIALVARYTVDRTDWPAVAKTAPIFAAVGAAAFAVGTLMAVGFWGVVL